jgi:hypothetical protein
MALGHNNSPNGPHGQNKKLPEFIDRGIIETARREFKRNDALDLNPRALSDEQILEAVDWDGPNERQKKWLFMAAQFITEVNILLGEQRVERQGTMCHHSQGSGLAGEPINWGSVFVAAEDAVGHQLSLCASTVRAALQKETFEDEDDSDLEIGVEVPRYALQLVDREVRKSDEVTAEEIIGDHKEAIQWIQDSTREENSED